jgi:hypothetical protein
MKVAVTSKKQKINCRISLMQRLNQAFERMIPEIRRTLNFDSSRNKIT